MSDTAAVLEAAAGNADLYAAMRELLEERGASPDVLDCLDRVAAGDAHLWEALSKVAVGSDIVQDIEAAVAKAEKADATAYQLVLDEAVREADAALTDATEKLPARKDCLDRAVKAERDAQDATWKAEEFQRTCDADLRGIRDKQSAPEAEATAMAKARDAADIVARKQALLRDAVRDRQAAQKELIDAEADVTAAEKALASAQANAANPGRPPYSVYTLTFLGPWLLLYGKSPLTDDETAFVRGIVRGLAQRCNVDQIIAREERARIEAERRTVSDRAIQSLAKTGARIRPPTGHNEWPAGALPAGAIQS